MSRLRKAAAPGTALAGTAVGAVIGVPWVGEVVAGGALFVDSIVGGAGVDRSVDPDDQFASERVAVYQAFGTAVIGTFQAAELMMTYEVKPKGALHGLLAVMRAQRTFEHDIFGVPAALDSIFLLGGTEAQQSAKTVMIVLAEQLMMVGSTKQAGPKAKAALASAGPLIGDSMVA
jgi:hypothetical protein